MRQHWTSASYVMTLKPMVTINLLDRVSPQPGPPQIDGEDRRRARASL